MSMSIFGTRLLKPLAMTYVLEMEETTTSLVPKRGRHPLLVCMFWKDDRHSFLMMVWGF